jgi:hypothetical protein
MAYLPPIFNDTCQIFRMSDNDFTHREFLGSADCQFKWTPQSAEPTGTFPEPIFYDRGSSLLLPKGTDVAYGAMRLSGVGDLIFIDSLPDAWWYVGQVYDVHRSFPNEFRVAVLGLLHYLNTSFLNLPAPCEYFPPWS